MKRKTDYDDCSGMDKKQLLEVIERQRSHIVMIEGEWNAQIAKNGELKRKFVQRVDLLHKELIKKWREKDTTLDDSYFKGYKDTISILLKLCGKVPK